MPGPWKRDKKGFHIRSSNGYAVCQLYSSLDGDLGQVLANGALIEAALDMLDALYAALPFIEDDGSYKKGYVQRVEKKVRDAIAKAEGEV